MGHLSMNIRPLLLGLGLCIAALVAADAQAPDRSKLPEPGTPRPLKLPAIQKRQLTNGLPVWIVELHEVPVVQANLLVLSGSADDPPAKYGVASMTAAMLENGAGSRSALEIADSIDFLGANLTTTSSSDFSRIVSERVGAERATKAAKNAKKERFIVTDDQ